MRGERTREAIRSAAVTLFAERGYAGASVRDIAAVAGVDPALVIRHFGSKEALFLGALETEPPSALLLEGPVETLGRDFIAVLLESEVPVRSTFLALLRASDSDAVGLRLGEVHDRYFVDPLRARLAGADADRRARVAASVVGGLLYSLWVVEDRALADTAREDLVAQYGEILQRLITPDAGA